MAEKKSRQYVNIDNITTSVFTTGQYNAKPEAKAKELTSLLTKILSTGIWESVITAAKNGIPAGTYVIVDDPKTPEKDFKIEIVPFIRKK